LFLLDCRNRLKPSLGSVIEKLHQVVTIAVLQIRLGQFDQLVVVDVTETMNDLLDAGNLEPLAFLHYLDKVG